MIAKLALRLILTRDPEHRWRRVVIPVASAVLAMVTLVTLSLLQATDRANERFTGRLMQTVESETRPTDLFMVSGRDVVAGREVTVYWIQQADPNVQPDLPAGISAYLIYPTVFVSPAADHLLSSDLATHLSVPDRAQIVPEGLQDADELLMYRTVPPGTDLSSHPFAVRLRASNGAQVNPLRWFLPGWPSGLTVTKLVPATIALLIIPAVVFLMVALGAASGVRDHRFGVLRAVGAPRGALVRLSSVEALLLALPGTLVGVATWWVLFQRIYTNKEFLPLLSNDPLAGDLAVPRAWFLSATAALVVAAPLAAGLREWISYGRPARSVRPAQESGAISPWRLAPVGLLAFGVGARVVIGQDGGAFLFLLSAIVVLALLPFLLPVIVQPVGSLVRRLPATLALLAGRGIEWDTIRAARPFLSIGVLVAVALGVAGFRASIPNDEPLPDTTGLSEAPAVSVNFWSEHQDEDYGRMVAALADRLVLRSSAVSDPLRLVTTCPVIKPYYPSATCDPADPLAVPEGLARSMSQSLNFGFPLGVQFVTADDLAQERYLVVVGTGSFDVLIDDVRRAARANLLWTSIHVYGAPVQHSFFPNWLATFMQAAMVILAIGAIVAAVDRFMGLKKHRSQLLHIGLLPRQLGQIDAVQFLVVVLVAIGVGAGLGTLTVTQFLADSPDIPVPWDEMRTIIWLALAGAVAGTLLLATFEVRRFSREERPF